MRPEETAFILPRSITNMHNVNAIPDSRTRDEIEYYIEIERIFDHQKAVYPMEIDDDIDIVNLARHFYNECYNIPIIQRKSGPQECSVSEFIEEVILAHSGDRYNRLSYLIGDVGVGKTAFINYLITVRLRTFIEKGTIWFLRLDLHDASHGAVIDELQLFTTLMRKAAKVISQYLFIVDSNPVTRHAWENFIEHFDHMFVIIDKKMSGAIARAFSDLVSAIRQETDRRLFMVLDNMDFMCHLNDRALFYDDEDTGELPFLLSLHKLVGHFMHDGVWEQLGANILFVTRFDSYHIIRTADITDRLPNKENVQYYTLTSPPWEDVFDSRKKLIDFTTSQVGKRRKKQKFQDITRLIERHMNSGPQNEKNLAYHLTRLTNYGMRELMLFFSQYAWIGDKDKAGRLIHQYPVGLITFMLGSWCLFSQMNSAFPNIYLVNIEQRGTDDSRDHEHPHTYWLKRMIAQLIEKRGPYKGTDYISIFVGTEGDGYGQKEIREGLGSLSEANTSNMAKVLRERNPKDRQKLKVQSVQLTPRGEHCLSSIFDGFIYLQLIVDDYLLPLPRCILPEFNYSKTHINYSYISSSDVETYWSQAKEMIKWKAKQVMLFLVVLEKSLEIEMDIHSSIFRRLEKDDVYPPKIPEIKEGVKQFLISLSSKYGHFLDMGTIENFAKQREGAIYDELLNMYML